MAKNVFVRLLIAIPLFLASVSSFAVPLQLTCDAPTERTDGTPIDSSLTYRFYREGVFLVSADQCAVTHDEPAGQRVSFTVTAVDDFGLESEHSNEVAANLIPPKKPQLARPSVRR